MTKRECPSCTAPMNPFQAGHVQLDRCNFCRGLWFDAGELEQVLGRKLVGAMDQSTVTARRCAQCKVPMRSVELGGLQVEVCTSCRGVFLDDGELVALNDGKRIRVQTLTAPAAPAPAPRSEAEVKDDLMSWLDSMSGGAPAAAPAPAPAPGAPSAPRGIAQVKALSGDLPTDMECPQCNHPMRPFMIQSRNPGVDVELDRCHNCGGVWFDSGELEIATGRSVIKSMRASDRFCPRCAIPLLNAELTAGVAVEACRTCKGTYLDARDIHTVTKQSPAKPPEDVSFVCEACHERKPFAHAQPTSKGTVCSDCYARAGSPAPTAEEQERASVFSSFVGWLRKD